MMGNDLLNVSDNRLTRFLPNSVGGTLRQVVGVGGDVVRALLPKSATSASIDPAYQVILEQQMELQRQMLLVSMHSNLEKTRHDIQMAPVRNIRVS
jgi:hypothetical protein